MTKNQVLISVSGLALVLSTLACSGGGRNRVDGRECSAKSKPTFDFNADSEPGSKKLEINEELPAGKYTYGGAHFTYESKDGFMIQVRDSLPEGKSEFAAGIYCVRGFAKARQGMGVNTPGLAQMTIDTINGTSTMDIELKEFGFIMEGGLKPIAKISNEKPTSPEKAYEKIQKKFIIERPNGSFEVRSFEENADGYYILSVQLQHADIVPQP